jgi:hypothetical protein
MSDKPEPPKKGLEEPEAEYVDDGREMTDAELEAWEERNKDALQASFDRAREAYARGEWYTWEEVKAELEAQAKRRQAGKG